jgi:hypothetical protein
MTSDRKEEWEDRAAFDALFDRAFEYADKLLPAERREALAALPPARDLPELPSVIVTPDEPICVEILEASPRRPTVDVVGSLNKCMTAIVGVGPAPAGFSWAKMKPARLVVVPSYDELLATYAATLERLATIRQTMVACHYLEGRERLNFTTHRLVAKHHVCAEAMSTNEAVVLTADVDTAAIVTLGSHMCKWPIGDPATGGFSFCGRRVNEDGPYCRDHARVAYRPGDEGCGHHTDTQIRTSVMTTDDGGSARALADGGCRRG